MVREIMVMEAKNPNNNLLKKINKLKHNLFVSLLKKEIYFCLQAKIAIILIGARYPVVPPI